MATVVNAAPAPQKKEYKATIERIANVRALIVMAPRQMDSQTRQQCLDELLRVEDKIRAWHGGRLHLDPSRRSRGSSGATQQEKKR